MARADEPDERKTRGSHGDRRRSDFRHGEQVVRAGTLLVSATELVEPTFRRTVVYIIEHNDSGSLGVVINRPSTTEVRDVLPKWSELATDPGTLFIGGPVNREAELCLATLRVGADTAGVSGLKRIDGRVVLVDLDADPEQLAPVLEGLRIFTDISGWTFGQLEGELQDNDWIVLSALPSDPISTGRPDLWAHVLRRQPLPLSLLATHPIELERN